MALPRVTTMQYLQTGKVTAFIVLTFIVVQPVYAAPKTAPAKAAAAKKVALCEKFFSATLYNGFLEQACGFDGQVKDRLASMMDTAHCLSALSKIRRDKLATQVLDDAEMRLKAYGEDPFCEGNIKDYSHLMDILPETGSNGADESDSPDNNSQL